MVALTENLILLQFEFCIDYDVEAGGKVLLNENVVDTVVLLTKGNISSQNVRVELSLEDMDMSRFQQGATYEHADKGG